MYKKTFTGRELHGTPERKATPRREGKPAVKGIYEQNVFPSEEFKKHTQKGDPAMIWLFKGQEAKVFDDEQAEDMYRKGWSPRRPDPVPAPKKQPPEPKIPASGK